MEEIAVANRQRFGRSTEAFGPDGQISFQEVDGTVVFFNEAEAVCDEEAKKNPAPLAGKPRPRGKKQADISKLEVVSTSEYYMTEDELSAIYKGEGCKRLPDEIMKRYYFVPAKVGIEEIHTGIYAGKKSDRIVKAKFPAYLMRNSLVSPSLEAGIINAKYVNAVPLYRIEKQFDADGLDITRQEMARWTIASAERYLSVLYDYLHERMYQYHVLHADETPVLVNKDGRNAGSKSYMWVYLKVFLDDPYVPLDNNSAEQSIRSFCIGKKNFVMIDTISGAKASAIIYSLVETAKANNLNVYGYMKHLLTVIPNHMDDHNTDFCEDLLPWSDLLPEECRKKK